MSTAAMTNQLGQSNRPEENGKFMKETVLNQNRPFTEPAATGNDLPAASPSLLAEEDRLIRAAGQGDLTAFNQLVTFYQDSLFWWICSLVQDEALAADVTQQAFIKAYQKLDTYRGGSFRAWLFRIARNQSYDEIRRIRNHPTLRLEEQQEDDEPDLLSILPDPSPLPEQALEQHELSQLIEQSLERLPAAFQQVLRMVDMEGMDYLETAAILDIPVGTVKSRLTRARLKLRLVLVGAGYRYPASAR